MSAEIDQAESDSSDSEWVELESEVAPEKHQTQSLFPGYSAEKQSSKSIPRPARGTSPVEAADIFSSFGTIRSSREVRRTEKTLQKSRDRYDPTSNARELNPYWKSGEHGLPTKHNISSSTSNISKTSSVSDAGASWLRAALDRCQKQAIDNQQSLEEVVSSRWGSLDKFINKLNTAEKNAGLHITKLDNHSKGYHNTKQKVHSNQSNKNDGNKKPQKEKKSLTQPLTVHRNKKVDNCNKRRLPAYPKSHKSDKLPCDQGKVKSWKRETAMNLPKNKSPSSFINADVNNEKIIHRKTYTVTMPPITDSKVSIENETHIPESFINSRIINDKGANDTQLTESQKSTKTKSYNSDTSDLNKLNAQLIKAELKGDTAMVDHIKSKLAAIAEKSIVPESENKTEAKNLKLSHNYKNEHEQRGNNEVILTRSNRLGVEMPVRDWAAERDGTNDHARLSVKELALREKYITSSQQNMMFAHEASSSEKRTLDADFDVDEMHVSMSKKRREKEELKLDAADKRLAILEHKKRSAALERCTYCMTEDKRPSKHLIIHIGEFIYLRVPHHHSLVPDHCQIVPQSHYCSSTQIDENVWEEIYDLQSTLIRLFSKTDRDVLFIETVRDIHKFNHLVIDVIPLDKNLSTEAPIYFHKAIMDSDNEWAQNKKLIKFSGSKGVRGAIPNGFSYFSVMFSHDFGFAHVIEESSLFPHWWGLEVIGGMLDLDTFLWRRPRDDSFKDQCEKCISLLRQFETVQHSNSSKNSDSSNSTVLIGPERPH